MTGNSIWMAFLVYSGLLMFYVFARATLDNVTVPTHDTRLHYQVLEAAFAAAMTFGTNSLKAVFRLKRELSVDRLIAAITCPE